MAQVLAAEAAEEALQQKLSVQAELLAISDKQHKQLEASIEQLEVSLCCKGWHKWGIMCCCLSPSNDRCARHPTHTPLVFQRRAAAKPVQSASDHSKL